MAGATLSGIPGCGSSSKPQPDGGGGPPSTATFPQGVASGDPQPDSVVLWTRALPGDGGAEAVVVTLEVASDSGFGNIVVTMYLTATFVSDHCVRVLVTGLQSGTAYYYRFRVGTDMVVGQTRTAPDPADTGQVNIAWVTCQDYQAGNYGALRQMLIDDAARDPADQIHFVLHVGDVIYETVNSDFQKALDDSFNPITITNADGSQRLVPALPSGGGANGGNVFAATLDDYRSLYQTFLSDPDMMAARARWPFVHTWDDHEFTDDCWQSMANYDNHESLDEPSQTRRYAASQAWFEYIPALLTGAQDLTTDGDAVDFTPVAGGVMDAAFIDPDADNFVEEPNNVAAIGAITIYRSLGWGANVDLIITDQRSYRSDHAIPEEVAVAPLFFNPRNVLPINMVQVFDEGMTANGGSPPAMVDGYPNPRVASPVGTMLGAAQKQWWKDTMMASTATWRLWANEVIMMRFLINNFMNALGVDRVMDGDGWDGYPSERVELMGFLRDNDISNVVLLSGDIHATFAGIVMDDFDSAEPTPIANELVVPGISSNSLFSFYEAATRALPAQLRSFVTVDATTATPAGPAFQNTLNMTLLHGLGASLTYAQTLDLPTAESAYDPTVNPHLLYADSNSQGYGYVQVTATEVTATMVVINRPIQMPTDSGPGVLRTATFTIPANNPAGMTGPTMTGTKPFPMT